MIEGFVAQDQISTFRNRLRESLIYKIERLVLAGQKRKHGTTNHSHRIRVLEHNMVTLFTGMTAFNFQVSKDSTILSNVMAKTPCELTPSTLRCMHEESKTLTTLLILIWINIFIERYFRATGHLILCIFESHKEANYEGVTSVKRVDCYLSHVYNMPGMS